MVLRRCHTSHLKFGIWFLLTSEIVQQNQFFAKWSKNGNQIDVNAQALQSIYSKFRVYWLKIALRRSQMCLEMSLVYRLIMLWHVFKIYVYVYKRVRFCFYEFYGSWLVLAITYLKLSTINKLEIINKYWSKRM